MPPVVASSYPPAPDGGLAMLTSPSHPTEPRQRRGVPIGAVFWRIVTGLVILLMVLAVIISQADWSNMP